MKYEVLPENDTRVRADDAKRNGFGLIPVTGIIIDVTTKDFEAFSKDGTKFKDCTFTIMPEKLSDFSGFLCRFCDFEGTKFSVINLPEFHHSMFKDGCKVTSCDNANFFECTHFATEFSGDFSEIESLNTHFSGCHFDGLRNTIFNDCYIQNGKFENTCATVMETASDFTTFTLTKFRLIRDCTFTGCYFLSSNFGDENDVCLRANFNGGYIVGCSSSEKAFRLCFFDRVHIINSVFKDTLFENVSFVGCDFCELIFEKCRFSNVTVFDDRIEDIRVWKEKFYIDKCEGSIIVNEKWLVKFAPSEPDELSDFSDYDIYDLVPTATGESDNGTDGMTDVEQIDASRAEKA